MALTDIEVKKAKPKSKRYKIIDGQGLFIEVMPNGKKYWRLRLRKGNKDNSITLGQYPAFSLKQARAWKDEQLKIVASGVDLKEYKEQLEKEKLINEGNTFEKVARAWHKENLITWKDRTARDILNRIEKDIFVKIGNVPIKEITNKQLHSVFQEIVKRGSYEIAKRNLANCTRIFAYAIKLGYCDRNIAQDLKGTLPATPKKHFNAITFNELPTFLQALENNEARLYLVTRYAIWLMLYTFVRTSELINAKWSEINLEKGEWIIPYHRMKMGNKKINPDTTNHFVPLSSQAVEILKRLKTLSDSDYVFPSVLDKEKPISNGTILGALKRIGYKNTMTGHGFRTLAMSSLLEMGFRKEVADIQLAHKPAGKVLQVYSRNAQYKEERIKMMQAWADAIEKCKKKTIL